MSPEILPLLLSNIHSFDFFSFIVVYLFQRTNCTDPNVRLLLFTLTVYRRMQRIRFLESDMLKGSYSQIALACLRFLFHCATLSRAGTQCNVKSDIRVSIIPHFYLCKLSVTKKTHMYTHTCTHTGMHTYVCIHLSSSFLLPFPIHQN